MKPRHLDLFIILIAVLGWRLWLDCARAADHNNLEEGLPTQVEDAYPIAYGGREIQGLFRFEKTDKSENRYAFVPRIEYGFARNWQAKLEVPIFPGNADRRGSGDIRLEALYNFNTESLWLPAFALSGGIDIPAGTKTRGVDPRLKFIMTKSISQTGLDRIHFNFGWRHNFENRSDERDDPFTTILGYSRRLGADTTLVADFVREWKIEKKQESNILELGLRRQLDPLTLIAIGGGGGIGDESPKFRITLGFQRSF